MEIERKFLINQLPSNLNQYEALTIEQGYLCTDPVVRIRQQNNDYFLTYKSKGFLSREEVNLPLTKEAYLHLRKKADGHMISKTRYLIPIEASLKIELDIFHGIHEPLILAEIEFETEQQANSFSPPSWFGEDVTYSSQYHNSTLSKKNN
ncbi:CYTH domain-containing protein [Anaerosacchariphilus polymeriproducens]|uniref:CYTH domain-containing protein n=1 Tax=Anaerosacchariphilus polymeriproducens TaxID=1812858 RepID=A0A371AT00_9FIRM|nr:CYTH domain-containing protein [Anaerosacchariphilus polymeriproducens]RDU22679.1 CYTH domain-containing protein [Anaerosacchariphilus polymeriproducens]